MAYDGGEHVKEVFAYFGKAYYASGVLETGIVVALLQIDFLNRVRMQYRADQGQSFDRGRYETEFDRFMENHHAQTLGNLLKRVYMSSDISDGLKKKLGEAKKRRDFLAHHYFRERAVEFCKRAGRDKMIAELHEDGNIFEAIDKELYVELAPIRERLGMSDKHFQAYITRFRAEHGIDSSATELDD